MNLAWGSATWLSSMLAGSFVGSFVVLAGDALLLRLSLMLFCYFLSLVPRGHFEFWERMRGMYTVLWCGLAALALYWLPHMPWLVQGYGVLVKHVGGLAYCVAEAIVVTLMVEHMAKYLNEAIVKFDVVDMESNAVVYVKSAVLGIAFATLGFSALLGYQYVLQTPWAFEGKHVPIHTWMLPLIAAGCGIACLVLSYVYEAGMICEGSSLCLLLGYCLWTVRGSAFEKVRIVSWIMSPEFPHDQLIFLVLAIIVLCVVVTWFNEREDDSSGSFKARNDYIFETEPCVKACLVVLGTSAIGTFMGYFDNKNWIYFRALEMIVVPLFYTHRLILNSSDSIW